MSTQDEIKEEYKHNYRQELMEVNMLDRIPEYLGSGDATNEWLNDTDNANSQFVSISSYNEFREISSVFLVGRIGTGKTAMLNKLKYSIEHEQEPNFKTVLFINTNDHINELSSALRLSIFKTLTYTEKENLLFKKWTWVLNVCVMQKVREVYGKDRVKKIDAYLRNANIVSQDDSLTYIMQSISEEFSKGNL